MLTGDMVPSQITPAALQYTCNARVLGCKHTLPVSHATPMPGWRHLNTTKDNKVLKTFALFQCNLLGCCREYIGHCSHVANVRFSLDNTYVVSVGSADRAAMQWRVLAEAVDEVRCKHA